MKLRRYVLYIRDCWCILGMTGLVFIGLEICTRIYLLFPINYRAYSDVYMSSPWVFDYFHELDENLQERAIWHSYVYWRRKEFSGNYINIDSNGIRKTHNITPLSEARSNIFMFGGSTLWGIGARDEYTIPSLVSKSLIKRGYNNFHIINFGEPVYVSTQGLIQLMLELRKGNIPDVVIFYDGVNDVFASFQNKYAGSPQNEDNRRKEFALNGINLFEYLKYNSKMLSELVRITKNALEDKFHKDLSFYGDTLSEKTISYYFYNMGLVEKIAKEHQFSFYAFWQPTIFSKEKLSFHEINIKQPYKSRRHFYEMVYSKITSLTKKPSYFSDLQSIFADRAETIFIDFCHIGELGNQIIAEAMVQTLMTKHEMFSQATGSR